MKDFLTLNNSGYASVSQASADYLRSDAFKGLVKSLSGDPRALARLTINLLEHVALDPLAGSQLKDFAGYSGPEHALSTLAPGAENTWFCLSLNRMSNFIGSFTLFSHEPECDLLLAAIQRNLDSKMFKAAAMQRRFDKKQPARTSRFERLSGKAYTAVMDEALKNPLYVSGSHSSPEVRDLRERVLLDAQSARAAIFNPLVARRLARYNKVAKASTTPGYYSGYSDILAMFAVQYVIPQHQKVLAELM